MILIQSLRDAAAAGILLIILLGTMVVPAMAGNTFTVSGKILAVQPPVADFTASPTSGMAPLAVQFTDASTGAITSWKWEYRTGAGSWTRFSTTRNPSYTFTETATYDIRLTVAGTGGSDTKTRSGYSTVQKCTAVVADFSGTPRTGTAPLMVRFTDQSKGTPTTWQWDFDNNGVWDSTQQNPSFTYTKQGSYGVKVQVKNPCSVSAKVVTPYITVKKGTGSSTTFLDAIMDTMAGIFIEPSI